LTLPQFKIFHDESKKRFIFLTEFGTGKTLVMEAKAKKLLECPEETIVMIVFHENEDSLLRVRLKSHFGQQKGRHKRVKIKGFKVTSSGENILLVFSTDL